MNTPNKLTMLRILMIPFFVAFMLWEELPNRYLWALIIFTTASLTDLFDGYLARKHNLITDFGKLMDPLADKLLVTSAMVCFVGLGITPSFVVIIILSREFLVTSIRLVAAPKGRVIAADIYGKLKTISQMVWIVVTIFTQYLISLGYFALWLQVAGVAMMWITTILTVFSGANYVYKNRDMLAD